MRRIVAAFVSMAILSSGCTTPTNPRKQLPFEIRVLQFESNSAHYPKEMFTGPVPPSYKAKVVPGMMEAIAVIAQATSDIFKWAYDCRKFQSEHEIGFLYFKASIVSIKWGDPTEPIQSAQMWREHERFLSHWPSVINMHKPENYEKAMQQFVGWYDEHPPERGPVIREMKVATSVASIH